VGVTPQLLCLTSIAISGAETKWRHPATRAVERPRPGPGYRSHFGESRACPGGCRPLLAAHALRSLPVGFLPPCLPTIAQQPPSGPLWWHEIKHDGFRVIARKDGTRVRLYSRPGNDLTDRFRLIVEALVWLRAGSCIIDGEAVCCGDDCVPSFDRIRYRRHDDKVFLYAFDLIELNGGDLRREPLDTPKATLASLLRRAEPGLQLNEHIEEEDGETVFRHACKLGLEGIVSKRRDSHYRSGRSPDWLKMKNPACAAVKRQEEEDWGR
jgi:bifunctional non-homologous end joining protein LigD